MSDPMNRPNDRVVTPPPESRPRKSANPLLWVLLLLAVLALGWYAYNTMVGAGDATPDVAAPAVDDTAADAETRESAPAANGEAAASRSKREPATRRSTSRPSTAINRAAQPIVRQQPDYPREALRAGAEGIVMVRAQVDANGIPTQVEVVDRSGSRELDRSALDAVRKWRFTPAMKDGRRVASTVQVPIEFRRAQQ